MVDRSMAMAEVFVEHVKNHLDKNQVVVCKICNKTIDEIFEETTRKTDKLWIQPGMFESGKSYIDRNGKRFTVTKLGFD